LKEKAEKKKEDKTKEPESESNAFEEDEGEWIGMENIEEKLNIKVKTDNEVSDKIPVSLTTADFTVQNVALKMGIPVISIDGMRIRKIKNYILKCITCETLNWDTTKVFCEHCGYNTLMKIGYSVDVDGNVTVYDKKADVRVRGTKYDLPKPSLSKKAVVYILSEDQIKTKKNEFSLEKNLDKILDNYDNFKELNDRNTNNGYNTSKNFVWGFPKQNPNVSKKYYSKKSKK
jgi:RNA-binding protein NOB1